MKLLKFYFQLKRPSLRQLMMMKSAITCPISQTRLLALPSFTTLKLTTLLMHQHPAQTIEQFRKSSGTGLHGIA